MSRVVVSGGAGFFGQHVCRTLSSAHDVTALVRGPAAALPGVRWVTVEESNGLAAAVQRLRPDVLVHCAFRKSVPTGETEARYLERVVGTDVGLLRACAEIGVTVVLVSSAAVYGDVDGSGPIDEACPRMPVSLYGVAKTMQEVLAEFFARAHGLRLCIVRPFNLSGPGQQTGSLPADWVAGARAIVAGGEPVLRVRTLSRSRDFVDVRDAAAAVSAIVNAHHPGAVNVASGELVPLVELAEELRRLCPVPFEIQATADATPASDPEGRPGATGRVRSRWGWKPTIDWRQSLKDMWDAAATP